MDSYLKKNHRQDLQDRYDFIAEGDWYFKAFIRKALKNILKIL
jgi:hypothetical protein